MRDAQNAFLQCVITSLLEKGCAIEAFIPQEIKNVPQELLFDIIIAFNKNALIAVTDFAQDKAIPIVYVFDDIEKNLIWNHSIVIRNYIMDTPEYQLPLFILQNKNYCLAPPLFNFTDLWQKRVSKPNFEELYILFYVNDKILLLLVPEINKIIHYKAIIVCDNYSLFRSILNPSIQVFESNKVSLSELISRTDIFVGGKSWAAQSIYMCKSTIIASQEGYGGLISLLNIKQQILNGFKGRIGGCNDEYIPVNLLFKDIDYCAKKILSITYNDTLADLSEKISKCNNYNIDMITSYIANYSSIDTTDLENSPLILDDNYVITAISNNKYLITDGRIHKYIAILSSEEYNYVKQFSRPQPLKQVLNQINILSSNEVESLLSELLSDHILKTPDE